MFDNWLMHTYMTKSINNIKEKKCQGSRLINDLSQEKSMIKKHSMLYFVSALHRMLIEKNTIIDHRQLGYTCGNIQKINNTLLTRTYLDKKKYICLEMISNNA
jgi:hypothetical protein